MPRRETRRAPSALRLLAISGAVCLWGCGSDAETSGAAGAPASGTDAAAGGADAASESGATGTRPYVSLVSFRTYPFVRFGADAVQSVNASPFHGVAIPLIGAYDVDAHNETEFDSTVSLLRDQSKKHAWPWLFFNRFIGATDADCAGPTPKKPPYFCQIPGLDLYNETGALQDYFDHFRIALRIAERLGSPGVFIDPEGYNDYDTYNLDYLSAKLGRPRQDLIDRLKQVGAEMVELTLEEYPTATLWFAYTFLGRTLWAPPEDYFSFAWLFLGMLDRAKGTGVVVVEATPDPCHGALSETEQGIAKDVERFRALQETYPSLVLGRGIKPWNASRDPGFCPESPQTSIADFGPYYCALMRAYDYVWVYAAGATDYNPYDPVVAAPFDAVLADSLARCSRP